MGMMHVMRNRMHFILWILLLLFVGSMTVGGLVGGANIIDKILGKTDVRKTIGVVNGDIISPDQFFQAVRYRLDEYRQKGRNVDDRLIDQTRSDIWYELIDQILFTQEIKRRNITVTDEEVYYHLVENPPQFIKDIPDFQTDEQFDQGKYLEALQNPQGDEWSKVEEYMRLIIPNFKLENQVRSSVTVGDEEVKNRYIKQNIDYTISGLVIQNLSFKDESQPSDEEILQYYNSHLDEFDQPEKRALSYVKWDKKPSQEDTLLVLREIEDLIQRIRDREDFATLADQFSEDPGNVRDGQKNGGDLGWFGWGMMTPPFEEAAFGANVGEVVGPVETNFGYHIISVRDKRTRDDQEEILVSHILLRVEMGPSTRDILKRQSSQFLWDVEDYGFEKAVEMNQLEINQLRSLPEDTKMLPGFGFFPLPIRFAFNSEVGASSDVFESDRGFAIFHLDSIASAGPKTFDEVKNQIQRELSTEKQIELVKEKAQQVYEMITDNRTFEEIAEGDDIVSFLPSTTKTLSSTFPQIGKAPLIIGALLSSEPGDLLPPLQTPRGYAIIKFEGKAEFDSTDWEIKNKLVYQTLLSEKQNKAVINWRDKLRESAEIIDNRKYFF